jgi:UDP-glucose/iron transport system ATP-binding protein
VDVTVRFEDHEALRGVGLTIEVHRISVLTGPSGSGETTLLRLCNRLEVPSKGQVQFRGDDVANLDPLQLRRRVGMVFQRPTLFAGTAQDNLETARPASGDSVYEEVLDRVGLPRAHLDSVGDTLSGGEAQRACLARTLLNDPEVLLMDEPTSSLDAGAGARGPGGRLGPPGLTVVWVSHDLAQVRGTAQDAVVLMEGRVAADDTASRYLGGDR